jgi:hypothetical protein
LYEVSWREAVARTCQLKSEIWMWRQLCGNIPSHGWIKNFIFQYCPFTKSSCWSSNGAVSTQEFFMVLFFLYASFTFALWLTATQSTGNS